MSDFICPCPLGVTIPSIADVDCKEAFGLVGKLAFQRLGNPFTDITLQAEWDAALAAVDATKIALTPLTLDSQEFPSSTTITVGGDDNTTFDGAPIIVGETSITATFIIRDLPIAAYKELKSFTCEIAGGTGVYLLGNNFVISDENDAAIKASSFFIGTPLLGGRTETNNYPITIVFPAGWWATAKFNAIDTFNPMDLVNP